MLKFSKIPFKYIFLLCCWGLIHTNLYSQKQTFNRTLFKAELEKISDKHSTNSKYVINLFYQLLLKAKNEENVLKEFYLLVYIGREYCYKNKNLGIGNKYYNEALNLAIKNNLCIEEINAKLHLNYIIFAQNKKDEFIKNYEAIEQTCKQCPAHSELLYTYTQLATNYHKRKDYTKTILYANRLDSLLLKHNYLFPIEKQSFSYNTLVEIYTDIAPEKLPTIKNAAINIYKKQLTNPTVTPIIYIYLANIYSQTNQLDSAFCYAQKAIKLPIKQYSVSDQEYIYEAYNTLSNLYTIEQKYDSALYYQRQYSQIRDSLKVIDRENIIAFNITMLTQQFELQKRKKELITNRLILLFVCLIVVIALMSIYFIQQKNSRISKLYIRLSEQKAQLLHLNSLRTKMFSILSHDLASPIGALINNIEMYEKGLFTKNDFELNQSKLKGNLSSILSTIRSVVSWSYIMQNSDKIEKELLAPYEIIEELFRLQTIHAQLYRHELVNNIQPDVRINANKNHFTLIARNLIDNAIKHTPPNGRIEVNCDYLENSVIFYFKDNGKGIKKDILENILTKKRTTSTTLIPHLGLQMVFDIVSLNHYSIDINSEENKGTTIVMKIPIEKSVLE